MQTEIANANGVYNKDLALERYNSFLSNYQARYTFPFPFLITWQTIEYWHRGVTMWGRYCVENGWLHYEQYLGDKAFRFGEPSLIKRVQEATALTKSDILNDFS